MTGKWKNSWQEALDRRLATLSEEELILEKLKYSDKELYDMERDRIVADAIRLLLARNEELKQQNNQQDIKHI